MRNLTRSPFQRGAQPRRSIMPANSYAEGGLASIPSYAEGDEVEIEETSTGEDILEFLANFGGAADGPSITDLVEYFSEEREGPSLQDAIDQLALMGGMPKGMSKGGVVPGPSPIKGVEGGPTVGYGPGVDTMRRKSEADTAFLNDMLGITPREWKESYGTSFPSSVHQGSDAVTRAVLSKVKQRTPPPAPVEDSKPSLTLPQNFGGLATSGAVEGGGSSYVAGVDDMDQLFDMYHSSPNYAAQAANLYQGGTPTSGLGLSQPSLDMEQLLQLAGVKSMSKGGVVPGSNPVQGVKGGPTVGFRGAGLAQQYEKNKRLFQQVLGGQYKDFQHYQKSRGHAFANPVGNQSDFHAHLLAEKSRLDAQKQAPPPPPPAPKPKPTLPQTFPELQTAKKVDDPGTYVAGIESLAELFDIYHPGSINITNVTESESEDPDYAAQAAEVYAGGTPTEGLDLSGQGLTLKQLLELAELAGVA